jgi:ribosomal protein S1
MPLDIAGTDPQLLSGDRVLLGTVEEIRSDQAKVDIGEGQPRYIPMNVRKDKGLPELKIGDLVEITVNDQNLLVDVHKAVRPATIVWFEGNSPNRCQPDTMRQ